MRAAKVMFFSLFILVILPLYAFALKQDSPFEPAAEAPTDSLQFTVRGHMLVFKAREMVLASADKALRVEFVNANAVGPQTSSKAVSLATKPDKGRQVEPLTEVTYADLWDGVSLQVENEPQGLIKSTYRVASDKLQSVENIRLRYNRSVKVAANGQLLVDFPFGQMVESPPVAWQEINGRRAPVKAAFKIRGEREVGFEVAGCHPDFPLIIDPILTWNTFLGGNADDYINSLVLDSAGNIYVGGYSNSASWGAAWGTPAQAFGSGDNGFVAKLDAGGSPSWYTFTGSAGNSYIYALALDSAGNVYAGGQSGVSWGPNIIKDWPGNPDGFVAKLNPTTGAWVWNTFISDNGGTSIYALAANNDYIYAGGTSTAGWGSPSHNYNYDLLSQNGLLVQLDLNGNYQRHIFLTAAPKFSHKLVYVKTMVLDSAGNIYLGGYGQTLSGFPDLPMPVNSSTGELNYDGYVAKFDSTLLNIWNTFMGGAGDDEINALAMDSAGNIYAGGHSPVAWGSPIQAFGSGINGFVAKLDSSGNRAWHTFTGSAGNSLIHALALNSSGNIYAGGAAYSDFGANVKRAYAGGGDGFVAVLNSAGVYQWNAFLGSAAGDEVVKALGLNSSGDIYVGGYGNATWGSPFRAYIGANDGFVANLDLTPPTITSISPAAGETNIAVSASINAAFSDSMDSASLTTATFYLSGVSGAVSYNSATKTVTFTPAANLAYNTLYTVIVTTGVKNTSDDNMADYYIWSFTTAAGPDTTPPTVASTSPANGATGIPIGASIKATFSEQILATTLASATFYLNGVSGDVSYNSSTKTAIFTPSANLAYNTLYTAIVTTGVTDTSGNNLAATYTWSFTTGAGPETTPPTVVSTSPANSATGTAVSAAIKATFSEQILPASLTSATFCLNGVSGAVSYDSAAKTAIFTPSANLDYNTNYTATITTGVKDTSGNNMAATYTWSFTTASLAETVVTSTFSSGSSGGGGGCFITTLFP
ncbi:MAG: Ig-like domain-containing protein [Deltaproteobacteria bacterium]|nr:Ig-like domain-containing protein [Deltaproteobacteria bacterium]